MGRPGSAGSAFDPTARIGVLTPKTVPIADYRCLPEYGERIDEYWVFRRIAPTGWPFLQ